MSCILYTNSEGNNKEVITMVNLESDLSNYKKETSSTMFHDATDVIPGGVTANIKHFSPYPIFMKEGYGSKLIDVDDEEYIDYSLCYGALMTGHGNERVMNATIQQMQTGGTMIFGTPHELELTMAEKLIELYPGIDQVRFTNSGTEAVLLSVRLAVAHTGKNKVAKFEGHYHGGLNNMLVSINPSEEEAGHANQPTPVIESSGIPESEQKETIILPFNDLETTEILLRKHADDLAAVILEPVQGGFIPAEKSFLHGLKQLTDELNIVLIFDEVKTCFRVHLGGAQTVYDIKPDITALGKVLGGGLPVGAVGGREDIMMQSAASTDGDVFSVGGKSRETKDIVFHSGTYNGHPLVLAAGLETISMLEEENVYDNLFATTNELRRQLEDLYKSYNIDMQTLGLGTIFNIIFTKAPIRNYRDMWQANTALRQAIDIELLNLGVYLKPLNRYSMSTAHTLEDVKQTVDSHEKAINIVLNRQFKQAE